MTGAPPPPPRLDWLFSSLGALLKRDEMSIQFFISAGNRMCQVLSGAGKVHVDNVAVAIRSGYVEVTGDEMDAFRAQTERARQAGWNPDGRISYEKFLETQLIKLKLCGDGA